MSININIKNQRICLALIMLAAVVVTTYFMPRMTRHHYNYEENRPWAYSLLTAPFDITVYRDSASVRLLTDSIDRAMVPIYRRDDAQSHRLVSLVEQSDSLSPAVKRRLANGLTRVYRLGVVDQSTAALIARGELPEVKYTENNVNVSRYTNNYISQRDAYAYIDSLFPTPEEHRQFQSFHLADKLLPNIVEDKEATRLYRESLLQPVLAGIGLIQKGEKIIGPAEIVTPQLYQVLRTYEDMLDKQSTRDRRQMINSFTGKVLYSLLLFGLIFAFMILYYPERVKKV